MEDAGRVTQAEFSRIIDCNCVFLEISPNSSSFSSSVARRCALPSFRYGIRNITFGWRVEFVRQCDLLQRMEIALSRLGAGHHPDHTDSRNYVWYQV